MTKKITIIGAGYIGIVAGVCLADGGNKVTCLDIDERKIEMLKNGKSPIFEPGLTELLHKNAHNLSFTTNYPEAIDEADIVFIAVGTPSDENGEADLKYVRSAAASISEHMTGDLIVVNRSTVPVGTGHEVEDIIKSKTTHNIAMISCPEFLKEGSAINDFLNPDRVVIGADEGRENAVNVLKEVYEGVTRKEPTFVITDLRSAEMIKCASNSFLATQISFINELSTLCEMVDVDVTEVARGMRLDTRIGEKAFLNAGLGFGGSCFPKDVRALTALGSKEGHTLTLLETVQEVNKGMVKIAHEKIINLLRENNVEITNSIVTVLGASFKPNTDDIRESQSILLMDELLESGVKEIRLIDPIVEWDFEVERGFLLPERMQNSDRISKIKFIEDKEVSACVLEGAKDSHILILATEWNDFRNLNFADLKKVMSSALFADLRNIYKKAAAEKVGFKVINLGRR